VNPIHPALTRLARAAAHQDFAELEETLHVALRVPDTKELGADEIALLQKLADIQGSKVRERSVLDKVKDLFG